MMVKAFLTLSLFSSLLCLAGPGSPPRAQKEAPTAQPASSIEYHCDEIDHLYMPTDSLYPMLDPVPSSHAPALTPTPTPAPEEPDFLDQFVDSVIDSAKDFANWFAKIGEDD